jgi:hypothetical protein
MNCPHGVQDKDFVQGVKRKSPTIGRAFILLERITAGLDEVCETKLSVTTSRQYRGIPAKERHMERGIVALYIMW